MSFGGRAASSSGCAIRPRGHETGSTGYIGRTPSSSPTGLYVMAMAEHREPCESRGSCTVLGAPGGETPPGDSTKAASLAKSTEPQLLGQTDALQLACRAPWNLGRNCSVPSRTKTQGFKSAKSAQRFVRPRAGLQHVQHAMAFETASDPRQFRTAANNSWSDATAAVAYAVRFLVARSFINMSTINMSTPSRQFQDSISVRARWRWPSTSPAKRERGQCNDDPCAVEGQSRGQHVPSGDRPDGRTRQEFMKVCHGFRMNQQLPNVGSGLDQKDPPVVSPQPSPNASRKEM
jgi:hypothetical protein